MSGVHQSLKIVGVGGVLLLGAAFSLLRDDANADDMALKKRRNLEAVVDFADPRTVERKPRKATKPVSAEQSAAPAVADVADESSLPPPRVEPNAHLSFESLLEEYVLDVERSNYLINVGAQDGKTHDPTYDLLVSGYEGILFEGFERMKPYLYSNIAAIPHPERVFISWGFVSPYTILQQLEYGHARKDADVLKVDIDSFDADLMTTILGVGGYQPKVVMVEFNPDVPPPFAWHQLYSSHPHNVDKGRMGNYGATASAWFEIMTERFGYGLVGMELTNEDDKCLRCEHNMWFVSEEFLNRRGYRTLAHAEMVELFWGTHYQNEMKCIHAHHPCLLFTPKELTDAVPRDVKKGLKKLGDVERNVRLSMMIAEEDVSCDVWKAYESSVVQGFLGQVDAACKCENLGRKCVEGDPCLYEWNVRTKPSNIC
eukprot:CAMPEP_0172526082 /NCGR_PEP_ID=MMETSP1067-20121228/1090_1 /TAXON_ID=265564 ORGANISM="Thalassiosira punctigera, Strain Tpunct2005C2" /NCGR_SAMPLE_ID=MMETSP1067 /ASSEMBLY_ACC=CAM_ASM_000444 /LENGTH=427 /DNA_ID=CAMNT_0013309519 /DNA_START=71 /DNA_END=1354 /DNA_ORIENTATION=-